MGNSRSVSTWSLIAIPAIITLGITILRVTGELQHWSTLLFNPAAGGGGAIIGISWLPIILGPYFALKLAKAGEGPSSVGRSIAFALLGLVVLFLSSFLLQLTFEHPSLLTLLAFLLMLAAAFIPRLGWRSLGDVLLVYAFAARIPVVVVMYLAMRGNGGAGWGTHYDVVPPQFGNLSFAVKYFYMALVPQMTLWIGFTVVVGSLIGAIVSAIARRGKQGVQAEA
ncbi:MAG: hypothetical protein LAO21_20505 [Acidobacteriia bacterium]|nr:hypothetical protein [Terriglobia bacterium]